MIRPLYCSPMDPHVTAAWRSLGAVPLAVGESRLIPHPQDRARPSILVEHVAPDVYDWYVETPMERH